MPRFRPVLVSAAVLATAALAMTGCASSATTAGSSGSGTAPTSIAIGLTSAVVSLDPADAGTVRSDRGVAASVYSALVSVDAKQKPHPDVATSWKQLSSTEWRFTLNPKAVFSDGTTPVDADVVKWNFDRLLSPTSKHSISAYLQTIKSVDVVDKHTVDVTLKGPDVSLFLVLPYIDFLDPEWAGTHQPATEAFGSGPYEVKSFTPSGDIQLTANPNYWGAKPAIKNVSYHVYSDATAEANALITDEIQFAGDLEPKDLSRVKQVSSLKLVQAASIRAAFIKLNTEQKPLDNKQVRQALNYAVDKKTIIKSLLGNSTTESQGQVLTPYFVGFNKSLKPYPYDPAKAKKLLAAAGYPNGFTLTIDVPIGTYVEGQNITQAINQQLQKVGVTLKENDLPFATYLQRYTTLHQLSQAAYLTQSQLSTDRFLGLFQTGSPYAYWENAEFTDDVNKGRYALTTAEAASYYEKAVTVLRDEAPVIFLFPQPKVYAVPKDITWTERDDEWILPADFGVAK